jgi:hypothetical protein
LLRSGGFLDTSFLEHFEVPAIEEQSMSASPNDRHGTDLLAQEIREEADRLVHHPIAEIKRLEAVVEEGDSAATPLLLFLAVAVALAVVVAIVMTVVFIAYYEG